jgi:hypothetical protein
MSFKTNFCTLLSFFLLPTLLSHASDSLKIKKTEYYENDKLVRITSFNQKGVLISDFRFGYNYDFSDTKENYAEIVKFKDGKRASFNTYHFKLLGDSVFFYDINNVGTIQNLIYDSSGKYVESYYERIYLKTDSIKTFSLASLEENIVKVNDGFRIQYLYDSLGREVENKWLVTSTRTTISPSAQKYEKKWEKINMSKQVRYDSLGRKVEFKNVYFDRPEKTIWTVQYSGKNAITEKQFFVKNKLREKTIYKSFVNPEGKESRTEYYIVPVKKSKVVGEPTLDFITESIYEDGRIVKIVYKSVSLGKRKDHNLKHYFY